jgi:hypothetical protein
MSVRLEKDRRALDCTATEAKEVVLKMLRYDRKNRTYSEIREGAMEVVKDAEGSRYVWSAPSGRNLVSGRRLVQVVHWLEYEDENGSWLRENPEWEKAQFEMRNGKVVER